MSDEITIRKNKMAEMAYVGEIPWHGLGQSLKVGANIETWKREAGMDWQLARSSVRYGDGQNQKIFEQHHVLFRSDTKEPLGIVSPKYKVVHPGEVLEFFRDLTADAGFTLHTAGTLFGGKQFWALASIGESACIVGKDQVDGYLLLSTSCDGSLATTARFTTVRVVCHNTLSMATSGKTAEVVVNHRSVFNAAATKDRMGIARGAFGEFVTAAKSLAKVRIDDVKAQEFVGSLLKDTKMATAKDVSASVHFQQIMGLFRGSAMGGTLLGAEGTAWGLVNGVTEYVDHRIKTTTDSHRMASAWFGRGDDLKTAAFQRALELV